MEAIAKGKYLRGSPQKARLVIDMIRGKNVAQALAILQFTNKRATDNIEKCLRSAIANATFKAEADNVAIDPDDLWVKTCFVDMGPHKNRRRVRPAPQGRAYREQRYYCHITIQVTSEKPLNSKVVGKVKKVGDHNVKPRREAKPVIAQDAPATVAVEEAISAPVAEISVDLAEQSAAPIESTPAVSSDSAANDESPAANTKSPAANETESTSEEKKTD